MKVAFVTSYYSGDQLDAVTTSFFRHVVQELTKAGHETVVFALGDKDFDDIGRDSGPVESNISISCRQGDLARYNNLHSLACAPVFSWVFTRAYETYRVHKENIQKFAPDVVLCVKALDGMFWRCFENMPVALMSVTPQFEIMRENFDGNLNPFDTNLVTAVETEALRAMNAISCPSKLMRDTIVDVAGVAEEKIGTYRIAIKESEVPKAWTGRSSFPHVVYIGTQERYKGIDVLIDAVPAIVAKFDEALITVAGESPPLFGETISYQEKLKERLGKFAKHVEWIPALDADQRASLVTASDIAVFPFRYCGCMYHVAEAMAVGGVVVCSAVGSLKESLANGETAVLVEPDNASVLASAVIELTKDKNLREKISKAAKHYIQENHSTQTALNDVVSLCQRAIDDKRGAPPLSSSSSSSLQSPFASPSLKYWVAALEDFCQKPYFPDLLDSAYAKGLAAGIASQPAIKR